jgi:hypothetical protein
LLSAGYRTCGSTAMRREPARPGHREPQRRHAPSSQGRQPPGSGPCRSFGGHRPGARPCQPAEWRTPLHSPQAG